MSELKTKATTQSVTEFLQTVEPENKRQDSLTLLALFQKSTGEEAVMWGTSIIGFGQYHYKSDRSTQEGDWLLTGFSPRKQNLTLYIMAGNEDNQDLLNQFGKHKSSSGCLYLNHLADVDLNILKKLVTHSFQFMKQKWA